MAGNTLRLRNAAEWRAWLERNHDAAAEAMLLISKKTTPSGIHYEEALDEALCFGWIDGKVRAHDAERFLLRFSPRKPDSIWSESNRDRASRLIRARRMRPSGLAKVRAAKASGAWDHPLRPRATPRMPSDLRKALQEVPEAWANFRAWGDSFQASYIHWVLDAKRFETRTRRIRRVVERSAQNKRPGIEGP